MAALSLANLGGDNGFRLDGVLENDSSGVSVSNAGDVNGDGFDDLIIGAPGANPSGEFSGASYVVFGKASGFDATMNLSDLDGSNGFRLDGQSTEGKGSNSGKSVSAAGDINGDGLDDLIVGDPKAGGRYYRYGPLEYGFTYVIFGKTSGFEAAMDLSSLDGNNGFRLEGESRSDYSGSSVSTAGDVNDDGFDDLIVGAPGAGSSYIIFGKSSGFDAAIGLSDLDGNNGFRMVGGGGSVSNAEDVNGDGFDDVIVGVPFANPNGEISGSSYIVFGKASGFDAAMDLSGLNGSNGFRLDGVTEGDFSGESVSNAGDVNGDGFDDVIVGAPFADDPNGNFSGSSYVVFGQAAGFDAAIDLTSLNGNNGFRLDGTKYDRAGTSVSTAGDVNGDGFDDLIIGAPYAGPEGDRAGSSFVMFGKASGFDAAINLLSLSGPDGLRLEGVSQDDRSSTSVSNAGDINKDGFGDLIIGAPRASQNGLNSGSSYVIFGRSDFSDGGLPIIPGTSGDDVLRGTPLAESFEAGDGNDLLIGRGGADEFHGGAGVDQIKVPDLNFASIDGGSGNDILHLDGKDLHLDLASVGDKIQGIETICIYGRGDNTLALTADSVLNLSDTSDTLKLHGNAGDRVTVLDDGWVNGGVKGFYHTYTNDDAVLLVGANLAIEFV